MDYSDDYAYAETRLKNTIVRYRGRIIRILNITNNGVCFIQYIVNQNIKQVPLKDLKLNSPKLGYVNTDSGPVYICRIPMREDWRQGLRMNNTTILGESRGIQMSDVLIVKAIRGRYPSLRQVYETLNIIQQKQNIKFQGLAVSRDIALDRLGVIIYKGHLTIGTYDVNDILNIQLLSRFSYLKERVEEVFYDKRYAKVRT
jgi:hypothetical protein